MDCINCEFSKSRGIRSFCEIKSSIEKSNRSYLPDCYILNKKYILKYKIEGGRSLVYYAYDIDKKKIFIAKELYLADAYTGRNENGLLLVAENIAPRFADYFNRFKQEANKLKNLSHIKVLPKYYDEYYPDDSNAFIIMEYIEGINIMDMKLGTPELILKTVKPLVKALIPTHENNIIHRDLSVTNVIIQNGKVKLLDFGTARSIKRKKSVESIEELSLTGFSVPLKSAEESLKHNGKQDSRTDVKMLTNFIIDLFKRQNPPVEIPESLQLIFDKQLNEDMEERDNIIRFYQELYPEEELWKRKLFKSTMTITAISIFCFILYMLAAFNKLNRKDQLIALIEMASGFLLQERYLGYYDFDDDGSAELFAFIPIDVVEDHMDNRDGAYDWTEYGEVWFSDGNLTKKVDSMGLDDWQGGGNYEVSIIQFGRERQFQVRKFYGPLTLDDGPINIYTYIDGQPERTHEGDSTAHAFYDDLDGEGTYYTTVAYKGSTQHNGRTWDTIYTYYKDGQYQAYKSELMDVELLFSYDNMETVMVEGFQSICESNSLPYDEFLLTRKIIQDREVILYNRKDRDECISIFNCYYNESGRIYLNLILWRKEEHCLNSGVWDNDKWHQIYHGPIELNPVDSDSEGYNRYIVFKIRKNELEVEDVKTGFWELYH